MADDAFNRDDYWNAVKISQNVTNLITALLFDTGTKYNIQKAERAMYTNRIYSSI